MLWEENKIDDYVDDYSDELNNTRDEKRETQSHNGLFEALKELKKPEVLCIGIIESIFQGVLTIFLFAWQPLLESSINTPINPGFIFTCFVICLILGAGLFEIFTIYIKSNYYKLIIYILGCVLCFFRTLCRRHELFPQIRFVGQCRERCFERKSCDLGIFSNSNF